MNFVAEVHHERFQVVSLCLYVRPKKVKEETLQEMKVLAVRIKGQELHNVVAFCFQCARLGIVREAPTAESREGPRVSRRRCGADCQKVRLRVC